MFVQLFNNSLNSFQGVDADPEKEKTSRRLKTILAANSVVFDSLRSDLLQERQKSEQLEMKMKKMKLNHLKEKAAWERRQQELDEEHQLSIASLKKDIARLEKQKLKMKLERQLEIEDHLETLQLIKTDFENQATGWMDKWLLLYRAFSVKNID